MGQRAVATGDVGLVGTVDAFRYQPVAITIFALGLVLLAVVGVLLAAGCVLLGFAVRRVPTASGAVSAAKPEVMTVR